MIEIQTRQLQRALSTLSMLGCHYAVRDPDGNMHGALKVEEPKPPGKHRNPRRDLSMYCFAEKIDTLQVGEVVVFDNLTPDAVAAVRSNVSSRGVAKFGKGNFTSMSTPNSVQGMRTK